MFFPEADCDAQPSTVDAAIVSGPALVCIISCAKNQDKWPALLRKIPSSVIVCADPGISAPHTFDEERRVLTVRCGDGYGELPAKIFLMFQSVLQLPIFVGKQYVLKIDDTDAFRLPMDTQLKIAQWRTEGLLSEYCSPRANYYNNWQPGEDHSSRAYHLHRCAGSHWNNKMYPGPFVTYGLGGCGYLLSRTAIECIASEDLTVDEIGEQHVYEDLFIAILLQKHGIHFRECPHFI